MFRLRLTSLLLKIGVFLAVGGPLAVSAGWLSGREAIVRYAAIVAFVVLAGFIVLFRSARNDDAC
ncbi:hypothetical protein [Burkholderia sp. Ac-20365]|jgi:hypothetical protein|uniref:hypothetical protein n=1 Tax=Burkholderia sp. Ac-20365 TaxID=2703897 RepID=UPI00197C0CF1|nr:hypothetical protein [Burkholderia sp. Ac-20365]MBN3762168.1 hypothetical protein [Burkholderia sp. Ac-20365]